MELHFWWGGGGKGAQGRIQRKGLGGAIGEAGCPKERRPLVEDKGRGGIAIGNTWVFKHVLHILTK